MLSRTTTARVIPDKLEEAVAFVRDEFAPAAAEQPGFLGFTLLVNRDQHTITGITFWESEDSMAASSTVSGTYQAKILAYQTYLDGAAAAML